MVRIALMSDMHGNCVALDSVLDDLRRDAVDRVVCLGDAVQGGPQPAEVVARLRELACPVVMGNADAWLLTGEETGAEGPATERMKAIRAWSLEQLSAEDRAFIKAFVSTVEVELPGGRPLLCFHGSPGSFDDIILPTTPDDEARRLLGDSGAAVFSGGHTHWPHQRRLGDALFVNPGSVGFAYDHNQPEENVQADHWAEYAVLSVDDGGGRFAVELRRVPFDVEAVVQRAFDAGMPEPEAFAARYRGRA
jgi:predicted phosphodiesterase